MPRMTASAPPDLKDPALYLNRELGQLEFNMRVLAQALDPRVPLLERMRYLCISCANLDEFFEVQVALLREHSNLVEMRPGPDAMAPAEVLARIRDRTLTLVQAQYEFWNHTLLPELAREGICFSKRDAWNDKQRRWLQGYFRNEILPVLSPLGLDPAHPFPRILNKSLNIAVVLSGKDAFGHESHLALVRAPRSLPRLIRLPAEVAQVPHDFVFLSSVLHEFMDELFPGMQVRGSYQFRVTRNSELVVDEEEVQNIAVALRDELKGRGYARAVRLEVADNCPRAITRMLMQNFELGEADVYRCEGPVNVNRVNATYDQIDRPDLKFPPFQPRLLPTVVEEGSLFEAIGERDILLHHPFDSFGSVIELVRQASADPDVLAVVMRRYPEAIAVSARTGEGIETLRETIERRLPVPQTEITALVPWDRGDLVDRVHREADVFSLEHEPGGTLITARVHPDLAAQLNPYAQANRQPQ